MSQVLRPVLVYALFGFLWILFSDLALGTLVPSPRTLSALQTIKGWVFIAVTALLLYRLIKREIRQIEASRRELEKTNSALHLLAEVNRAVAAAQSTEELISRVSELLAEKGYSVKIKPEGTRPEAEGEAGRDDGVIPLAQEGKALATLTLRSPQGSDRTHNCLLFQEIASILTRALENLQEKRARKEAENLLLLQARRLEEMSRRDQLTGLYNRQYLAQLLEKEAGKPFSLVAFDIERFGEINSLHGHAAGDRALAILGRRLQQLARRHGGEAVRLGGDAFVLFLPEKEAKEAEKVGEEVRQAVSQPVNLGSKEVHLVPRGTVISSPLHGQRRSEIEFALDLALQESLEKQSEGFLTFDPSRLAACPLPREEIRKALAENLILPVFQPIKELKTGHVHGYELLARLKRDDTFIPAAQWIKKAEEEGCLPEVEKAILAALSSCYRLKVFEGKMLFINLDARSLRDEGFCNYLLEMVRPGLAPRLVIEFTERHPLPEGNGVSAFLEELRRRGAWIALDDFGVGHSSISYFRKLRVDYIKIDQSLIREVGENHLARQLVQSINRLAREFRALTIAEGIEDASTAAILASLGIPLGQGYHLGHPQALEELEGETDRSDLDREAQPVLGPRKSPQRRSRPQAGSSVKSKR